ncbi:MAG: hypothetical protein ACE5M4_00195 [Anaerolineales bacterium]
MVAGAGSESVVVGYVKVAPFVCSPFLAVCEKHDRSRDYGVQSAHAADMTVVLIPNASFPPGEEATALAGAVRDNLDQLTVELIEGMD